MKVRELKQMLQQITDDDQEVYAIYDGYPYETDCAFEVSATNTSKYPKGVCIIAGD